MSRRGDETNVSENLDQTISSSSYSLHIPATRASLPIRGANPEVPSLQTEIAEISVDHLLVRESDLISATDELLVDLTQELKEVDQSIICIKERTNIIMSSNTEHSKEAENSKSSEISKPEEENKKVDWSAEDIQFYNFPGTQQMIRQEYVEIMNDDRDTNQPEISKEEPNFTERLNKINLEALINSRIQELLKRKDTTRTKQNLLQESLNTDKLCKLIDSKIQEVLNKNETDLTLCESNTSSNIGLKEALNLLPKSCDGRDIEQLDIFIEKCEFAMSCVVGSTTHRLLQAIMTRLTGKARQVTRNRTFEQWETLREFLKANLEPQRTTQHLYLELYSSKQKKDEDVLTYSMRIEELQTLIIEQETAELSVEAAQAMEISIKRQTKQVFMEGLGALKGFIKARNPPSLESAIQAAREEEKIKTSSEESKKLYHGTKRISEPYNNVKKSLGPCHVCKKIGHWAKDCRLNNNTGKLTSRTETGTSSNNFRSINTVTCQYCKKPGHTKDVCRKLKYVTNKRNEENDSGNRSQPGTSGGRPAGNLKTAVISFPPSS